MTTKQQKVLIIKGVVFSLFIAVIFLLSWYGPRPFSVLGPWGDNLAKFYTRRKRLARFLNSLGPYSAAVFMLLQALQVVVSPIPGELTGVVGGYVYGVKFGFLASTLGLTLGSWVAFELASIFGRPLVEKFVAEKVLEKFHFLTTNAGAVISFLLFVIPGFPKDYLCYILGLSGMNLGTFLIVSTIGRMPGTYLLTIQGASIGRWAIRDSHCYRCRFWSSCFYRVSLSIRSLPLDKRNSRLVEISMKSKTSNEARKK
jgi:uncharacterized membrane protein YdjX (TVP38/TMEM64 family)